MKLPTLTGMLGGLALLLGVAQAQQEGAGPGANPPGTPTIESINRDFESDLAGLERRRLERLVQLAGQQGAAQAESTYETYFRLVIESGLFAEAEATAETVLGSANPASPAASLAAIVNIIAEADRGDYEESLRSLGAAIGGRGNGEDAGRGPAVPLPRATLLSVAEVYYQRLVRADQFEVARRAFRLIRETATDPAVRAYAANRLRQLDLVGKPAPPIASTDIDGRPVSLADLKGNVVLIIFWATWYVPGAEDVEALDRVYEAYRGRGFRILGINLDTALDGGTPAASVLPNIRRFLLDHNVRWPNLVNGEGDRDHADAYGVTEIPSSFLIGRDGLVLDMDLARSDLELEVAEAVED